VIYPWGGGDLFSALTTYPNAKEITVISLARSGDPRRVRSLERGRLAGSLAKVREQVKSLLGWSDAKSLSMTERPSGSDFPAELTLALIALAIHGYEPTRLRYFRLEEDGSLHYLDPGELAALERARTARGSPRASAWSPPDLSAAFASSELSFVPKGADPRQVEPRIYRHLSASLLDERLAGDPRVLRYLEQKGRVAAMTKASGYHLWQRSFSKLRDYLSRNVDFMVSDSSGLPPSIAFAAGLTEDTFGRFVGAPFGSVNRRYEQELRALWSRPSTRALIFRYGYLDSAQNYHLMIARRLAAGEELSGLEIGRAEERVDRQEQLDGARHWRLWTDNGAVHVWIPPGYRASSAGIAVYVHGYYLNADEAWDQHQLAAQFAASGRNALFIVPEASSCDHEEPLWKELPALLETVRRLSKVQPPSGPLLVIAHSGGFRTVANWLDRPELQQVALLDGLYGAKQDRFEAWVKESRKRAGEHRLILTSTQTADRSAALAKSIRGSVTLPQIPDQPAEVGPVERRAPVLYMPSQYEHTELITNGKVIPLVLELSGLPGRRTE
jgi:hypothetical protein